MVDGLSADHTPASAEVRSLGFGARRHGELPCASVVPPGGYLLAHWVTDVAGGLVFGTMVLVVAILAIQVLDRPHPSSPYRAATRP